VYRYTITRHTCYIFIGDQPALKRNVNTNPLLRDPLGQSGAGIRSGWYRRPFDQSEPSHGGGGREATTQIASYLHPYPTPSRLPPRVNMAALMASTSAFAGVKVQARVSAKATRVNTVTTANAGGPKRVSARGRVKHAGTGKSLPGTAPQGGRGWNREVLQNGDYWGCSEGVSPEWGAACGFSAGGAFPPSSRALHPR